MIIKIKQTSSNIRQSFDVESENFYLHGEAGNISRLQTITLSNKNTTIKGVYNLSKWENYIPLRYLFGYANLTRIFHLYKNDNTYGCFVFSKHGFMKSSYVISLNSGEIFHCYYRSKGSFHYISIYERDQQIALVETYLSVDDYKYTHKLYLLDAYRQFADVLSLFVLYFASYHFAKRFHMSIGSFNGKSWSYSQYNDKYNSEWRERNFPDENFFWKDKSF